jgi:hypothetical protein
MRKLGLVQAPHLEIEDFEKYLRLFNEALTKEQVGLVRELFTSSYPMPDPGVVEEAS